MVSRSHTLLFSFILLPFSTFDVILADTVLQESLAASGVSKREAPGTGLELEVQGVDIGDPLKRVARLPDNLNENDEEAEEVIREIVPGLLSNDGDSDGRSVRAAEESDPNEINNALPELAGEQDELSRALRDDYEAEEGEDEDDDDDDLMAAAEDDDDTTDIDKDEDNVEVEPETEAIQTGRNCTKDGHKCEQNANCCSGFCSWTRGFTCYTIAG